MFLCQRIEGICGNFCAYCQKVLKSHILVDKTGLFDYTYEYRKGVDGKSAPFGRFREPVVGVNRCRWWSGLLPESVL